LTLLHILIENNKILKIPIIPLKKKVNDTYINKHLKSLLTLRPGGCTYPHVRMSIPGIHVYPDIAVKYSAHKKHTPLSLVESMVIIFTGRSSGLSLIATFSLPSFPVASLKVLC